MKQALKNYAVARKQAIDDLDTHRAAVHAAATAAVSDAETKLSPETQKAALISMIENALADSLDGFDPAHAPAMVAQFTSSLPGQSDIHAGNGRLLLGVAPQFTKGEWAKSIDKLLWAVLALATGAAPAGLFTFPDPWHEQLSLGDLQAYAAILAPKAYEAHAAKIGKLRAARTEAAGLVEAFAKRVDITPQSTSPREVKVKVINRGGDFNTNGITIRGHGATTDMRLDQLMELQNMPGWPAGRIEINRAEPQQPRTLDQVLGG